ncbi:MAG TPA: peptidoglycan bridge formation glycyltransferase FemA/FemB family protein [Ktedonobacterales bacterium]|nr:peptidoglycan bridge formation glycyltransferase FemA/FemB family protein [Ktedonobacterales bacterium]
MGAVTPAATGTSAADEVSRRQDIRVVEAQQPDAWDAAVLAAPRADLLQSWGWGEFKLRSGGWKPTRLLALKDDSPVAGVQLLARRVMGLPSLYAPRGPWWHDSPDGQAGLAALVRWLRQKAALRAPFLRADPLIADITPLDGLGFRLAPRQVQPRATIVVDLTPSDDRLLAAFNSQVRYNIRHATKKGVVVSEGGVEAVQPFWELLKATADRKGFPERDLNYFIQLAESLGERARVFLAHYNGALVYGALIVVFGQTAYYLYGASGGDRSVKPSELGQYQAMLWAKQQGATRYDMWGIPAHPTKEHPLYGVYMFKSGFGGLEQRYIGALDLPLAPVIGAQFPALEAFALKSLSFARGQGFHYVDYLD